MSPAKVLRAVSQIEKGPKKPKSVRLNLGAKARLAMQQNNQQSLPRKPALPLATNSTSSAVLPLPTSAQAKSHVVWRTVQKRAIAIGAMQLARKKHGESESPLSSPSPTIPIVSATTDLLPRPSSPSIPPPPDSKASPPRYRRSSSAQDADSFKAQNKEGPKVEKSEPSSTHVGEDTDDPSSSDEEIIRERRATQPQTILRGVRSDSTGRTEGLTGNPQPKIRAWPASGRSGSGNRRDSTGSAPRLRRSSSSSSSNSNSSTSKDGGSSSATTTSTSSSPRTSTSSSSSVVSGPGSSRKVANGVHREDSRGKKGENSPKPKVMFTNSVSTIEKEPTKTEQPPTTTKLSAQARFEAKRERSKTVGELKLPSDSTKKGASEKKPPRAKSKSEAPTVESKEVEGQKGRKTSPIEAEDAQFIPGAPQEEDVKESIQERLEKVLKNPENKQCADCSAPDPTWASGNLGLFICTHCSGVHRSLGTHISAVLSTKLDVWNLSQIKAVEQWGNARANAKWEFSVPPEYFKPDQHQDRQYREKYIRAKYVEKLFLSNSKNEKKEAQYEKKPVAKIPVSPAQPGDVGMVEYIGWVMIKAIEAKHLRPTESRDQVEQLKVKLTRRADPYCLFKLGVQKIKSKTQSKTLEPKWNEGLALSWNGRDPLDIAVFDQDVMGDHKMGGFKLDITHLVQQEGKAWETWVPLLSDTSQEEMEIEEEKEIDGETKEKEIDAKGKEKEKKDRPASRKTSNQRYKLVVVVKSARGLLASDSNGKSDPYCSMRLGSEKIKTPVASQTLQPIWNQQYIFGQSQGLSGSEDLIVVLKDWDRFSSNEFLGAFKVPLRTILSEQSKNSIINGSNPTGVTKWFPLGPLDRHQTKGNRTPTGEIQLSLTLKPWAISLTGSSPSKEEQALTLQDSTDPFPTSSSTSSSGGSSDSGGMTTSLEGGTSSEIDTSPSSPSGVFGLLTQQPRAGKLFTPFVKTLKLNKEPGRLHLELTYNAIH